MAIKFHPYLSFNGQCDAAFRLYEKCLRGKITFIQKYGESPMAEQIPAEFRGRIMHATLTVGDQVLQGADVLPEQYQKPQGMTIALATNDAAEAERVFAALAENGLVQMPLTETFWALRFGMVTDQFGTPWLINCEKAA